MQTIRRLKLSLLDRTPYAPDLAPSDYNIFPQLKKSLKLRKVALTEEVIKTVEDWYAKQDKISS